MEKLADKPVWVDRPAALQALVRDIQGCRLLAVDTESNSLFAYHERVCLIQFSTGVTDYLVDPLALPDLSPLAPVFASPAIEKIFHAAEYDIICLKRDFGFSFANIFDTMIAARILGYLQIGLAAMLESEFGITLDKRFQRANWGKRPLPPDQLNYARLDTHFLIELRSRLRERLQANDLDELAAEDFCRLTQVEGVAQENGLSHFWRLAGKEELTPQQLGVLYALYRYRESYAQAKDRPVFKVLSDSVLLEVAAKLPHTPDALGKIRGMNRDQLRRHAEGLLAAVERGGRERAPGRPARSYPNGRYLLLNEALRDWRKETAQQEKVESDIVLPRDVLEEIARQDPTSLDALQQIMTSLPWRFRRYGPQILAVIHQVEEK